MIIKLCNDARDVILELRDVFVYIKSLKLFDLGVTLLQLFLCIEQFGLQVFNLVLPVLFGIALAFKVLAIASFALHALVHVLLFCLELVDS